MAVREVAIVDMPKMTGVENERKVESYLKDHRNHLVIKRLRTNQRLTATDLEGLETTLREIGEDDREILLLGLRTRSGAPSLAHFVRSLVGFDRATAHTAFSDFLTDSGLTTAQIRIVEVVIDQLTSRGVMEASALYEAPL